MNKDKTDQLTNHYNIKEKNIRKQYLVIFAAQTR